MAKRGSNLGDFVHNTPQIGIQPWEKNHDLVVLNPCAGYLQLSQIQSAGCPVKINHSENIKGCSTPWPTLNTHTELKIYNQELPDKNYEESGYYKHSM